MSPLVKCEPPNDGVRCTRCVLSSFSGEMIGRIQATRVSGMGGVPQALAGTVRSDRAFKKIQIHTKIRLIRNSIERKNTEDPLDYG